MFTQSYSGCWNSNEVAVLVAEMMSMKVLSERRPKEMKVEKLWLGSIVFDRPCWCGLGFFENEKNEMLLIPYK